MKPIRKDGFVFKTNDLTDTKDRLSETTGNAKIVAFLHKITGSIRNKLMISFSIPIVFIIILGVAAYIISSKSIVNNFTNSTIGMINSTGNYFGIMLQSVEDTAMQVASDGSVVDYYSGTFTTQAEEMKLFNEVKNLISRAALSNQYIENAAIFTQKGKSVSSIGAFQTNNTYEEFLKTEEAAAHLANTDNVDWSGYHPFLDTEITTSPQNYAISMTKEYLNKSAKRIGFIQMDISMSVITKALKEVELPKGSIVLFISPDGREITSEGMTDTVYLVDQDFYQDAKANNKGKGNETTEYKGESYMFIYSGIGESEALVAALVPSKVLTSQADTIKYIATSLVLAAGIIAGFIGFLVSSGISSSVKSVMNTLSKMADGDLTVSVNTKSKDEFMVLSGSVNHMIHNMKNLITKTAKVGDMVINSSEHVTTNSELLLAASSDISKAINEIQQGIIQQVNDIEQCMKLTDELNTQVNLAQEHSDSIKHIAMETKNVVKDGIAEVDQLNSSTKANIEITNKTIKDIEELEAASKSITEIIVVINEIAEQTNLLSLNASIEAARAGISGRGFSVIADEIRKLSTKSQNSVYEIEKIIRQILDKTKVTVKTVKQTETISQTTELRLTNVVKLFHNINLHVDDLADKMDRISDGIEDINKAKNDTLNAIESISAVAEETAAASEEVDATAQQQLDAVTQLNEAAKALQNDAIELEASIKQFKTE